MENNLLGWKDNEKYFKMLSLMGQLSNLFSQSKIPYIHYRIVENMFCKYFCAENLSRNDISYDAFKNGLGVGIKTFQLSNGRDSMEKIAEFNQLSSKLQNLKGVDLAREVSSFRNDRISLADNLYDIKDRNYHIVGRKEAELIIFNTSYDFVDIENIADVVTKKGKTVSFNDGKNEYSFNYSKSVLMKRFHVPSDIVSVPISIMEDPYDFMENLLNIDNNMNISNNKYVILPLYSEQRGGYVPTRSGLNQWNAAGRKRDENEIYIPIPRLIHNIFPDFFPEKDAPFTLHLPNGRTISAKICQAGGKAIMSNPNSALGEWLLRDVMNMPICQLVTMNDLNRLGFNSVMVTKIDSLNYRISVSLTKKYPDFIEQELL